MDIKIQQHRLGNGLRVNLAPDPSQPVVGINLWYNVGSRNERKGRTGFAHLFEHMMFQGSEHVPDTQHIGYVERAGGSMNGTTWLDRTNYFETLPANRLELGLWLESDRMGFLLPAMTQEKLDNQRDVVKNERRWRIDNQPYGDWMEQVQMLAYPEDHPYHHSVIGSMDDLDAATLDDVKEFFRTYYAPANAVLTLCGDFEPSAALELIDSYFGSIPEGPPVPAIPGRTQLPERFDAPRRVQIDADVPLARAFVVFRIPVFGDDRFYAADVAAHLLGAGKSSRLYGALVREQRIARSASAYAFPMVTGASILIVSATGNPGVPTGQLEEAILAEVDRLREGVNSTEIVRAVTGIVSREVIGLQEVGERADQISMFTTLFNDPERVNDEIGRYQRVDAAGIDQFTAHFLVRENVAIVSYEPVAKVNA